MPKRRTVEVGAQRQDEANVWRYSKGGIGERGNERINEAVAQCFVGNEREGFLELVGDEENALSGVGRATLTNVVGQANRTGGKLLRKFLHFLQLVR